MGLHIKRNQSKLGIRRLHAAMVAALTIIGLTASFSMSAGAATEYGLEPRVYVGTEEECGESGAGTPDGVKAEWVTTEGNDAPALYLAKQVETSDCSSAVADVTGEEGITLNQLSFEYKTDTYCGAGAPRFNVTTDEGFYFVGGCANGTSEDLENGWTRVTLDVTEVMGSVERMSIVFDEEGETYLDNVSINGNVITGPSENATNKDQCKNNGWKNFAANYKNQGQCVAAVQSSSNSKHNR